MNDRERAGEQVAVMDEIVRVADEEAVDAVSEMGDGLDRYNTPAAGLGVLGWIRPTCWHGRAGSSSPGTR